MRQTVRPGRKKRKLSPVKKLTKNFIKIMGLVVKENALSRRGTFNFQEIIRVI
jgi:hypothetical protein